METSKLEQAVQEAVLSLLASWFPDLYSSILLRSVKILLGDISTSRTCSSEGSVHTANYSMQRWTLLEPLPDVLIDQHNLENGRVVVKKLPPQSMYPWNPLNISHVTYD